MPDSQGAVSLECGREDLLLSRGSPPGSDGEPSGEKGAGSRDLGVSLPLSAPALPGMSEGDPMHAGTSEGTNDHTEPTRGQSRRVRSEERRVGKECRTRWRTAREKERE